MAIQLQLRRGTTAQNNAFTGASAEITVNTDTSAIRVHDGVTAGGVELARSSQIDSLLVKSVAGGVDVTLSAGEAANSNHEYTGILTGNINVIVPANSHNFTAENLTTGAFTLIVKTATGTGIAIPQGKALQLYNNGTNVEDSNSAKANDAEVARLAGSSSQTFSASTLTTTTAVNTPLLNGVVPLHVNDIINGQFRIAQAGTSFAAPASKAYDLDGWFNTNTSVAVFTITKGSGGASDFSRISTITTADVAIAAGDLVSADTRIEGYDVVKYLSSQGGAFVLGFWVTSPMTGIHCVSVYNGTSSFVAEYTINTANTFEYKTIQVTATPVIVSATTGYGLEIRFAKAAGATYQTTAGSWNAGNFYATANQVNTVGTIGNVFALKSVTMNRGTVPTAYETSYTNDLQKCLRYLPAFITTAANDVVGSGGTSTTANGLIEYKYSVPPMVAPTGVNISAVASFTLTEPGLTSSTCTAITLSTSGMNGAVLLATGTGTPYLAGRNIRLSSNAAASILFTGTRL